MFQRRRLITCDVITLPNTSPGVKACLLVRKVMCYVPNILKDKIHAVVVLEIFSGVDDVELVQQFV